MNRIAVISVLACMAAAVSLPLSASTRSPQWPAGALDKDDPRVLAFYDGVCGRYADDNGLSGAQRDAYLANCRADMPAVFPVGYDEGSSGGGE